MEQAAAATEALDVTVLAAIVPMPSDARSFPEQHAGWCAPYPFRLWDVTLQARCTREFSFELRTPSWLRFAFVVFGGDIGFMIRGLQGDDEGCAAGNSAGRCDAAPREATDGQDFGTRRVISPCTGQGGTEACAGQLCLLPGTYAFVWDNRHSWFKPKHVWYKFKVVQNATVGRAHYTK